MWPFQMGVSLRWKAKEDTSNFWPEKSPVKMPGRRPGKAAKALTKNRNILANSGKTGRVTKRVTRSSKISLVPLFPSEATFHAGDFQ